MDINDRVATLINKLDMTAYQFAKELGYDRPEKIYTILNKRNKPGYDTLADILNHFTQVNAEWLMLGNGEMFKGEENTQSSIAIVKESPNPEIVVLEGNKNGKSYSVKKEAGIVAITLDRETQQENIAMVDTRAVAGYPQYFLEPEYFVDLPKFSLPGPQFRNATFRCFQVTGDSMTETLYPDDWVICQYFDLSQGARSFNAIKEGYVYVVVTDEAVLVKRLLNRVQERGKVVIMSDNEAYATREIDAEDVKELWYVKAKLSFHFPNTRYNTLRKISSLEADLVHLQERVKKLEIHK
jgi:phage repressor protein C with HTH and peptisase S24 domain